MALLVSFLKLISLIFTYINRFLINATFLRDTKRILIHLLQATEVNGVILLCRILTITTVIHVLNVKI